jgi:hypothetical protein
MTVKTTPQGGHVGGQPYFFDRLRGIYLKYMTFFFFLLDRLRHSPSLHRSKAVKAIRLTAYGA